MKVDCQPIRADADALSRRPASSAGSGTATQRNWIGRLLPSLTDVAFLLPIILLFARMDGFQTLLGDGDTGWHVRTGEWILANGRVPDKDIFSFTRPGQPWFAWEWLWDVGAAWLNQQWGMAAVVLASLVILAFTFALLFRLIQRKCPNVLIAIAVTLWAAASSSLHWLARPHLVTLLLTVVFYSILERVREGRHRLLFWLPAIMIVWTNLHGGFFVGILLIGGYAAGELAALFQAGDSAHRLAVMDRAKPYVLAGVGCALATLINPYFYHLHTHLFRYFSESYHFEHIVEFQSMSFHPAMARYFEAFIVAGVVVAFWNVSRKQYVYAALILGWMHLALIAGRNIAIFALVAAPPVAEAIQHLFIHLADAPVVAWLRKRARSFNVFAGELATIDRIPRLHLVDALAVLALVALAYAPRPPKSLLAEYDSRKYPAKALEALRAPEFSHSIFTQDEWGDYLIYRLSPTGTKVFVDGRSDFYGAEFNEKYLDIMNAKYDWQQNLDRYGINTVVMPPDAALTAVLKESRRWRVVYDDSIAVVFRAAAAGEQRISTNNTNGENRDRKITNVNPRSEPI